MSDELKEATARWKARLADRGDHPYNGPKGFENAYHDLLTIHNAIVSHCLPRLNSSVEPGKQILAAEILRIAGAYPGEYKGDAN